MDKCTWSLAHDGMFSIGALCRLIDDHTLPSLDTKTTWDKCLPRKVNIFMWHLKLDRLPHRLNFTSRGIEIPEISCSSCNGNVESNDHISSNALLLRRFGGSLEGGVMTLFSF
ncbi:RNA-directed DNA polymerase, eukaryota [Tanacetum coccineum]